VRTVDLQCTRLPWRWLGPGAWGSAGGSRAQFYSGQSLQVKLSLARMLRRGKAAVASPCLMHANPGKNPQDRGLTTQLPSPPPRALRLLISRPSSRVIREPHLGRVQSHLITKFTMHGSGLGAPSLATFVLFALLGAVHSSLCTTPRRGEPGHKRARAKAAVQRLAFWTHPAGTDAPERMAASVPPIAHLALEPDCVPLCLPTERSALEELKVRLWSEGGAPSSSEVAAHVHGDVRLLRFLRKHPDVDEAADCFVQMLEWHQSERLDANPALWGERCEDIEHHEELHQYMPVSTVVCWEEEASVRGGGGSDVTDALMHMNIGSWDTHGLVDAVSKGRLSEDDFIAYWARVNEIIQLSCDQLSRTRGELVGCRVVCDFQGTSWRQFSRPFLKLVGKWSSMSEFYPSTSIEILFVNAPSFFTLLWGFIQPILSADTKSKIRLASVSETDALLERYGVHAKASTG
jgi:hypothetical protein